MMEIKLSKNWIKSKIEEITLPVKKINQKPTPEKEILYIDISSIDNKKNRVVKGKKYKLSEAPSRAKQIVKKGDVLFATVRPYLRNIAPVPSDLDGAIASTGFAVLRPAKGIDPSYIYYFCISNPFVNELSGIQYGVSYPAVKDEQVRAQYFPLPPTNEQKRIVAKIEELFSELDNGIESLKKAKEQLKLYRQSVLMQAFEEDEILWGTLAEICTNVEYGTSSKSQKSGEIPVLRMGNIQNYKFDWSDLVFTSDKAEIQKYNLKIDDVLFNRTNSPELVGKTAIYKGHQPAIFAGYLIRINYKKELVNGDYLNFYLNSHIAKKHGDTVKSDGVNQSNINGTKLKKYPFPKCSLEKQKEIVTKIETQISIIERAEFDIETNLKKAETLRQSILKKAFSGHLVPQDPNDEPASVLLEKIKAEKSKAKMKTKIRAGK